MTKTLSEHIEQVSVRLAEARGYKDGQTLSLEMQTETLVELQNAMEELRVAEEELRQQADELAESHEALQKQRERYRELFDFAPDPYIVTDEHGLITEANRAAEAMLAGELRLVGLPMANLVVEEDRQAFRAELVDVGRGKFAVDWQLRLRGVPRRGPKGGREKRPVIPVAITASKAQGREKPGSGAKAIRWMIRDITGRRRSEQDLREAHMELERRVGERTAELAKTNASLQQEVEEHRRSEEYLAQRTLELAESNAELQHFAYVASHDLKEPLRGISNYSRFLIDDYAEKLDDAGRDKLKTLSVLCKRMYSLLDSLLEYSRVGRTELRQSPTDMSAVLTDAMGSIAEWLREEQATVREATPLPVIYCDRLRAEQVLRNLIANAIIYNRSQRKVVEVGVATPEEAGVGEEQSENAWPILYVRDNGIGIPSHHQEMIFTMFKRLHARDRFGGGTGAGLAIVRRVVERHGGRIWARSDGVAGGGGKGAPDADETGPGTTMFFTLGPR